jgi:hypothetical protein
VSGARVRFGVGFRPGWATFDATDPRVHRGIRNDAVDPWARRPPASDVRACCLGEWISRRRPLATPPVNDRWPAGRPPLTLIANKTGKLDGVVNDAGIIFGLNASFVLIVLSAGVDQTTATIVERNLARATYDRFDGRGTARR